MTFSFVVAPASVCRWSPSSVQPKFIKMCANSGCNQMQRSHRSGIRYSPYNGSPGADALVKASGMSNGSGNFGHCGNSYSS